MLMKHSTQCSTIRHTLAENIGKRVTACKRPYGHWILTYNLVICGFAWAKSIIRTIFMYQTSDNGACVCMRRCGDPKKLSKFINFTKANLVDNNSTSTITTTCLQQRRPAQNWDHLSNSIFPSIIVEISFFFSSHPHCVCKLNFSS